MDGTSTDSEAATAHCDTPTIPTVGSSSRATKARISPLVPLQLSIGRRALSRQGDGEEDPMRYTVIYEQGDTSWGAYVPDLPGCTAVAESREEVEKLIVETITAYLDDIREAGQPVPPPRSATGLVEVA